MALLNTVIYPYQMEAFDWGGCSVCGKHDGYMNLGSEYWAICHEHKTKWIIGECLCDGWDYQTLSEFYKVEHLLQQYIKMYPIY